MSEDNGKEKKLIFNAAILDGKMEITLGKEVSMQQIAYAHRILSLQIDNTIIGLQTKKKVNPLIVDKNAMGSFIRRLRS